MIFQGTIKKLRETIAVNSTREINDFAASFNKMSHELYHYQHNLELQVEERTKKIEQKLKEIQKLNIEKDKFFTIISHDLRSPFSGLLGFIGLLKNEYDDYSDEKRKQIIGNVHRNAEHTYELLDNLLTWSRIERNKTPFNPEKIDLEALIDNVLVLIQTNFSNKELTLNKQLDPKINHTVYADKEMVKLIIRNLLYNAVKYTKRGGRIEIGTQSYDEKYIKVFIKDNGIGMDESTRKKLFDLENISSVKGTENEQGTGLGLILVKEFVKKNSGKIWVESKVDQGSKFSFTLPKGDQSNN